VTATDAGIESLEAVCVGSLITDAASMGDQNKRFVGCDRSWSTSSRGKDQDRAGNDCSNPAHRAEQSNSRVSHHDNSMPSVHILVPIFLED
jgi:hypothetical protein